MMDLLIWLIPAAEGAGDPVVALPVIVLINPPVHLPDGFGTIAPAGVHRSQVLLVRQDSIGTALLV